MVKKISQSIKHKLATFRINYKALSDKYYMLGFINGVLKRTKDDEATHLSAQITYYMLLAIFPFLIFLLNLLIFFDIDKEIFLNTISKLIPEQSSELIFNIVSEVATSSGFTLLSIGMITTLWSASKGVNALIKGLNKAYDVKEDRSFFKVKAVGLIATIGIPVLMIGSFIFLVLGQQVGQFIADKLGLKDYLSLWTLLRVLIPLASMTLTLHFCINWPLIAKSNLNTQPLALCFQP